MPTQGAVEIDYETLFRSGPGAIVITDSSNTIVQVNDHMLTWTGFSREELVGTSLTRLLPPADRILFSARTVPLLYLEGRVSDVSFSVLGKNREALAVHLSASRVNKGSETKTQKGASLVGMTVFLFTPRRERTAEEQHVISAVRHAEKSDVLRREAEDDLAQSAQFDALTSLLSREGLMPRFSSLVSSAPSARELVTIALGLDHFRVVNESLGQAAGDQVLRAIAQRLAGLTEEGFLCARVGGDEFVVVGSGVGRGVPLAERILELVSGAIRVDDLDIVVTASVGVSTGATSGTEGDRFASFAHLAELHLRHATTAMYKAKATGRNRWKRFTSVVDDSAVNEIRLLGEIRNGLAEAQFRLDYQPQLHVETGRLHGYEALMRWHHPDRGLIGPAGFINVAERSGLVNQLGAWACRTAIDRCVRLNAAPDALPVTMSVNVSARQLGDPRLAEMIGELLAESGLDPALLTLEITESGLITDSPSAHRNLELLHSHGVRLSIDDFGTGHAGFAYLKDFPVDELKIDGSFVSGLGVSAEDTAIVASCIDIGHAMGMSVVAEGIETREQLERLTEMGCDIIQGYFYSMPLADEALESWQPPVN